MKKILTQSDICINQYKKHVREKVGAERLEKKFFKEMTPRYMLSMNSVPNFRYFRLCSHWQAKGLTVFMT